MPKLDIPAFLPMVVDEAFETDDRFEAHERGVLTAMGYVGKLVTTGEKAAWIACDLPTNTFQPSEKQTAEVRNVEAALGRALTKIDGTGTRRRLQALVALGWPPAWIAERLGRDRGNFRATLQSADEVTARTASDVASLYDELWNTRPQPQNPRGERAISDALAMAAKRQWSPPLAWDDIDADPEPPTPPSDALADIDEIAVELARGGRSIRLCQLAPAEQDEVVRRLTENGKSLRDIAEQLATSTRTVSRRRRISAA